MSFISTKNSIKWHKSISIIGGIALLLFVTSGLTHILMTWTGPRGVAFFPPKVSLQATDIKSIPDILKQNDIATARVVKVVPSEQGPLLQVTQERVQPRRYFKLDTHEELPNYDEKQAVWLARYYTGLKEAEVKSVEFQTEFDNAYPWVNRLLPVYRIQFQDEENRTALIDTEISVLASITNPWKTTLQTYFKQAHTFSWLEGVPFARVLLMLLLLGCLAGLCITGFALIITLKNRRMPKKRKWHRLLSYAVWLPLLLFSASGTYHLLRYEYGENHRGMVITEEFNIDFNSFSNDLEGMSELWGKPLNALSLIKSSDDKILYRASFPPDQAPENVDREQRFKGVSKEGQVKYFDAMEGSEVKTTDKDIALNLALKALNLEESQLVHWEKVTRFGLHYDFRNKRIPVWRFDFDTPLGDKLFVDPATGILVDRLTNPDRYEGYSFSFLHKWNFLRPIGRENRDIIMVIVLLISLIMCIFGFTLLMKPKRAKKNKAK